MSELLLGRTYTSDLHVIAEPPPGPGRPAALGGLPAAGPGIAGPGHAGSGGGALAGYGLTSLLAALRDGAPAWALVTADWQSRREVVAGQRARHDLTITRVRPGAGGGSLLSASVSLRAEDGTVLEQGSCEFSSPEAPGAEAAGRYQFGTVEWGKALVPYLARNEQFTAAIASYDGTIGLAAGAGEVHFRLYKGTVLEVVRRAVHGADFTLEADDSIWVELILGGRNDFMDRAMKGQFRTRGSGYEYLRMTKALVCIIDAAREAAATGEDGAK